MVLIPSCLILEGPECHLLSQLVNHSLETVQDEMVVKHY